MSSYKPVPSTEEEMPVVTAKYDTFSSGVGKSSSQKFERTLLNPFRDRRITVYFQILGVFLFIFIIALAKYTLNSSYSEHSDNDVVLSSKPNFVFVLADDVGWNSFGYEDYDLSFATPHMTTMANKGIIMTNYYSQEVCTPARASLLTGRYPFKTGLQFGAVEAAGKMYLRIEETLLPRVLKEKGGYINYIIGKWNLGHEYAKYLPTARGFDYFLGFLDGHNYYWSKKNPIEPTYTDFMYANTQCYNLYNGSDMGTYATRLYGDKAVDVIKAHDFSAAPMFLYFATQAGHDPFTDTDDAYSTGITSDLVGSDRFKQVSSRVVGVKRQQYAMQLMILDDTVNDIYNALDEVGQLSNTYFIVTSDNGGCYAEGGKNGPLRGSKGSLYEGGTKVDAFIYSNKLSKYSGTTYSGLMHVTDWFPTMLTMANIKFTPSAGMELDGVDQSDAMKLGDKYNARETMVYNMYMNVDDEDFDIYTNSNVAVRNKQFKLIHAYTDNYCADWYTVSEESDNDDNVAYNGYNYCGQTQSLEGNYVTMLFDLVNDPYETTDLFSDSAYASVKAELYGIIEEYTSTVVQDNYYSGISAGSFSYWKSNDNFVQPFSFDSSDTSSPTRCDATHVLSPPV